MHDVIYPSLQYHKEKFCFPKNLPCFTYSTLTTTTIPPPNPWRPLIYLLSLVLPFPKCHVAGIIHCVVFSAWLISLSAMISRFFHVVWGHFFYCQIIPIAWIYHNSFVHLPIGGYLGCFLLLAFMNKVSLNIFMQIFMWT